MAMTTDANTHALIDARDRDLQPIHYAIRKHAHAAASPRAKLREWIWRGHAAGISHEVLADLAETTTSQIDELVEHITTLALRHPGDTAL
jgi:hypothetical protein